MEARELWSFGEPLLCQGALEADLHFFATANNVTFILEVTEAGVRRVKGPFGPGDKPQALLRWVPTTQQNAGHYDVVALYNYF